MFNKKLFFFIFFILFDINNQYSFARYVYMMRVIKRHESCELSSHPLVTLGYYIYIYIMNIYCNTREAHKYSIKIGLYKMVINDKTFGKKISYQHFFIVTYIIQYYKV